MWKLTQVPSFIKKPNGRHKMRVILCKIPCTCVCHKVSFVFFHVAKLVNWHMSLDGRYYQISLKRSNMEQLAELAASLIISMILSDLLGSRQPWLCQRSGVAPWQKGTSKPQMATPSYPNIRVLQCSCNNDATTNMNPLVVLT